MKVSDLRAWKRNPRRNAHVVDRLAAEIRALGFGAPIVAQHGTRRIIAGHTRQLAVLSILRGDPAWTIDGAPGPGFVPVRTMSVDDVTADKLALADNNAKLQGEWDDAALLAILGDFRQQCDDALASAGWNDAEIDGLLAEASFTHGDESDQGALDSKKLTTCPSCGHEF